MEEKKEKERWMTVAEVAEYLQLSKSKIYAMAQRNEIPCKKVVGRWRFKRSLICPAPVEIGILGS